MKVNVQVRSNISKIPVQINQGVSSGGNKDYRKLIFKPQINSVELVDDHNGEYYGLLDLIKYEFDKAIIDKLFINIEEKQQAQDKALSEYKTKIDTEQEVQNKNIQQNALDIQKKVNSEDYEATEKAQNTLIQANKDNLAKYEEETRQGFLDERELSLKEHQEAIDLANEKAVINDLNISPNTTFSSYESATRLTCTRTLTGSKVEFNPIEGYPISTIVRIEAVRQPSGDYSGWDNVDITQDNGGTHKVYNQPLNATCFGGRYEPHKGKLTITHASKNFNGSEAWEIIPLVDGRKQQFVLRGAVTNSSNDLNLQLCNSYNIPEVITPNFNGVWIADNDLYVGGGLAETFNDLSAWKANLSTNNLQMVYGLDVVETEIFEQQVINAQSGVNSMYANTGEITITTKVEPVCQEYIDSEIKKTKDLIPIDVSQLNNDLKFQTEDDVKRAIQGLGNVFEFKGAKTTRDELDLIPMEERTIGDVWFVEELSVGFIWLQDSKGQFKWEKFGSEVELKEYVKKTDIVDTTGSATDKVMSQKAITDALLKKVSSEELTTILENYIQKGELPQGVLTEEDLNRILGEKNYQNADQVKATKVNNAGNADTLDGKTYQQIIDLIPEVDLTPYAKKNEAVLSTNIRKTIYLTAQEYNNIPVKEVNTLYVIVDEVTNYTTREEVQEMINNSLNQIPFAEGGSF